MEKVKKVKKKWKIFKIISALIVIGLTIIYLLTIPFIYLIIIDIKFNEILNNEFCKKLNLSNIKNYDINKIPTIDWVKDITKKNLIDIQFVSSHNSFHKKPVFLLSEQWDYNYNSISEQLNRDIHGLEFDIYFSTISNHWVVTHIKYDYKTICPCLVQCLIMVNDWREDNDRHEIILIILEIKDANDINSESIIILEREILSVFSYDDIFFPYQVKIRNKTMAFSLNERGWPSLNDLKGKVYFYIYNGGKNGKEHLYRITKNKIFFEGFTWSNLENAGFINIKKQEDFIYKNNNLLVKCDDYLDKFDCIPNGAHYIHKNV